MVDGELTRVLLFYNPEQPAWYAWWVGEETGRQRRQAMVASGHFMLTQYVDHDAPVDIRFPPQARRALPDEAASRHWGLARSYTASYAWARPTTHRG
jgi:hypothetical protein